MLLQPNPSLFVCLFCVISQIVSFNRSLAIRRRVRISHRLSYHLVARGWELNRVLLAIMQRSVSDCFKSTLQAAASFRPRSERLALAFDSCERNEICTYTYVDIGPVHVILSFNVSVSVNDQYKMYKCKSYAFIRTK